MIKYKSIMRKRISGRLIIERNIKSTNGHMKTKKGKRLKRNMMRRSKSRMKVRIK